MSVEWNAELWQAGTFPLFAWNVFGKDHSERNEGPFCPSNCCWSCPPLLHLSSTLAVFQLHHLNAKQQVCFMSVTVQHSFVTLHAAFS